MLFNENKLLDIFKNYSEKIKYDIFMLNEYKKSFLPYKNIYLFGYGKIGVMIFDFLKNVLMNKNVVFIDNDINKHSKKTKCGVACYGLEILSLCNPNDSIIIITSAKYSVEIVKMIAMENKFYKDTYLPYTETGIAIESNFISFFYHSVLNREDNTSLECFKNRKKIFRLYNLLIDDDSKYVLYQKVYEFFSKRIIHHDIATYPQYFPDEIRSKLSADEVFIDCGAYYGDTIKEFIFQTNNEFKSIYAFEMDELIYKSMLQQSFMHDDRVLVFNYGVSDENKLISYERTGCPSYVLTKSNDAEKYHAEVKSLDSMMMDGIIKGEITFVKMDIEGAELDALRGMKELIRIHKPKLAISVYHRTFDLWEIPMYIYSLLPEYKFILRHHSDYDAETVLYAWV